jgi:hypothetical protein
VVVEVVRMEFLVVILVLEEVVVVWAIKIIFQLHRVIHIL